jgi:hypothetical protein
MRHLRDLGIVVVLASLACGGCAAGTSNVFGRTVTLVPSEDSAPKARGELIAVDGGRLWVRTKDGVRDFDPAALREVRVRRHHFTAGWAVRWGVIGGLASGVAMTAACASVEGNSGGQCARTGAIWGGTWLLVGLLAAPGLDGSSQTTVDPRSDRLKSYARLPAGLPRGVDPQHLIQGPPAPR